MAVGPLESLVHHVRRLAHAAAGTNVADAEFLQRFVSSRDEAAFEVLVWRHGAMVLGLCRRLLGHEQDAEDAFQATFLTLARKARSIAKGQALASWLYKVAFRIALAARSLEKRSRHEPLAFDLPAPEGADEQSWRDTQRLLDEEVRRLPEKYRAAFVLCHLEGKTNDEAARDLGCPRGTILSRLGRARERLRNRLSRRGVTLSAAVLSAGLAGESSAAALPANLVASSVQSALGIISGKSAAAVASAKVAALTEGVLYAMFLNKVKIVVACLIAFVACGLAGGLVNSWVQASAHDDSQIVRASEGAEAPQDAGGQDAGDPLKLAKLRAQSQNNLKHIALALHSYHDVNNQFPTPASYDKSGKPLLSWRVAILPYLEQAPLYEKFKLDEPWDSPHNKKLLDETPMPAFFAVGEATNKTYYQAIVGKDTPFEPRKKIRVADIHDGTSNTLGIVEAARAVPWTKPEDLPYVDGQALPALGGLFDGDFNACLMDGSVRLFPKNVPEAMLRLLITRNDGHPIDFTQLPPTRPGGARTANPGQLLQLNQRLQEELQVTQLQIKQAKEEIFRLHATLEGNSRLDAKTLKLLQQNAELQDALQRNIEELETLRRERARLEAQLKQKPKQ